MGQLHLSTKVDGRGQPPSFGSAAKVRAAAAAAAAAAAESWVTLRRKSQKVGAKGRGKRPPFETDGVFIWAGDNVKRRGA